ncbi:hypothetical protein CAMGR0001_1469 [Campylobacter gracilis RM3268]|uniref:Uncharacterized protein n=1 Tax=Campylobacter gracilis RM3268 TaxID=553220 RepID=C8PJR9_9BACT|nr:hypothetical protein CAMGR0001_1469 [Campylobacter gracilis RM3268]
MHAIRKRHKNKQAAKFAVRFFLYLNDDTHKMAATMRTTVAKICIARRLSCRAEITFG